jgi:hypothetical protein
VPVRLVHVRDLGDQRVVGVWIRQQGADGQQHLEPNTVFVGSSSHGKRLIDRYSYIRESPTLDIVSAGLHWSLRMSRQMLPLLLMFGWNTLVRNATCTLHSIDQGHMLWNRGLWIVRMHGYSAWRMNSWTWEIFKLAHEWLESQTTRTYSVAITRWII